MWERAFLHMATLTTTTTTQTSDAIQELKQTLCVKNSKIARLKEKLLEQRQLTNRIREAKEAEIMNKLRPVVVKLNDNIDTIQDIQKQNEKRGDEDWIKVRKAGSILQKVIDNYKRHVQGTHLSSIFNERTLSDGDKIKEIAGSDVLKCAEIVSLLFQQQQQQIEIMKDAVINLRKES